VGEGALRGAAAESVEESSEGELHISSFKIDDELRGRGGELHYVYLLK